MEWRERSIEVTIPNERCCRFEGIRVHRSSLIARDDSFVRDGILVTKPTWTLVALSAVVSGEELQRAVRHALAERITSLPALVDVLIRVGPARGTRALRKILAQGAVPTRSVLEDVVYDLIVSGGFVPPEVNQPMRLEGRTVYPDFRWPEQRLIIEADSSKWHDDSLAQPADADRQALLERHGETVLRVRWDEAMGRPEGARKRFAAAGAPRL